MTYTPSISIVFPCLNEEKTVGIMVKHAIDFLRENGINGEVIVSDNNSIDNSVQEARNAGAKVVFAKERGYGNALLTGFHEAEEDYIIFADCDCTYSAEDFKNILESICQNHDFINGNRLFKGKPQHMTMLHYLGNRFLTGVANIKYGYKIGDYHCGLKAFKRSLLIDMDLHRPGMEFATEITRKGFTCAENPAEVPIILHPEPEGRMSHLRVVRDGIRHLLYILGD